MRERERERGERERQRVRHRKREYTVPSSVGITPTVISLSPHFPASTLWKQTMFHTNPIQTVFLFFLSQTKSNSVLTYPSPSPRCHRSQKVCRRGACSRLTAPGCRQASPSPWGDSLITQSGNISPSHALPFGPLSRIRRARTVSVGTRVPLSCSTANPSTSPN